ncbi:MAG TPA: tyrosine-type recombinase/integrase [Chitinophagaceae bacterium]|nr:tyrosine-type recombinase/integrase [Chitinophagaceae bacterium]
MTIEKYLQQHYSPQTAKAYGREIEIYISNYPDASKAVHKDITTYIGALRNRYSKAATLRRIVSSIKVYYDYLCSEGTRSDNPAKAIRLRDKRTRDVQLQDLFTTEELEALVNRNERYANLDQRNKVLISLLIYQALTPQEMESFELTNIYLQTGSIYIKSTSKTAGRTLQLKPNQILLFHQYITEVRPKLLQGNPSNALLIGMRGEAMTAEDITKHIKRSFKALYPNRKVNAQTIRQSVIANLLKQGHDVSVVQSFAGHKYPSATERYKQSEVETLKAAVNKYHPLQ